MDKPKFEADLTAEQFDVFMAALNNVHRQILQGRSGSVNLLDNFGVEWSSDSVKFEVKANEV